MKEKHRSFDEMDYVEVDIVQEPIDIGPESFTFIVDKGTLDSVACGADVNNTAAMLRNIWKMLTPGGTFVCVSRGSPETRLLYFQELKWTIETIKIQKTASGANKEVFDRIDTEPFYYVYVCVKEF